ncbi:MAG TPA: GNAT family N-acetyltransferase [Saprospiraceae bacterium]|nr:GNAT family N-acetyltransferase [Saprospiraceae bacterium]
MKEINHKYNYRPAILSDLSQLRSLGLVSYGTFRNIITNETWKQWGKTFTKENLTQLLNKGKCFVCEYEDQIIGMAFLIPHGNPTEIFHNDWSYLRLVSVLPNFEGKGIGKQLTRICIEYAIETGERIIALHTSEFQDAARHIYENMGFVKVNEFEIANKKYWVFHLKLINTNEK